MQPKSIPAGDQDGMSACPRCGNIPERVWRPGGACQQRTECGCGRVTRWVHCGHDARAETDDDEVSAPKASETLHHRLARDLQHALGACGALGGSIGYPDRHADLMRFEALDATQRLEQAAAAIRRDVADDEARERAAAGVGACFG